MSKHRRPTRLQQLGTFAANSPVHLGIAAGVAGTLTVTGTVVASAADSSTQATKAQKPRMHSVSFVRDDIASSAAHLAVHDAVDQAQQARREAVAEAKARAERRRQLAKERAAERRAAERRAARQAERSRSLASASRGIERMSPSAANVLAIAAQAASGARYQYGATGPNAFDCSGYTGYVFAKMGISLPRTSSAQRAAVRTVSNPQPGDLVFVYNGGGGSIGHVGIYAGNGYWWEASNPSAGVGKHRAWSTNVSYGRVL